MVKVVNDSSLPENVKSLCYNDILYKFIMLKCTQSTNPLLNPPAHQNALTLRTTSSLPTSMLIGCDPSSSSPRENTVCDPALVRAIPSTIIMPRSQRFTTSFAIHHLTPPKGIAKPSDTRSISAKEKEKYHLLAVV